MRLVDLRDACRERARVDDQPHRSSRGLQGLVGHRFPQMEMVDDDVHDGGDNTTVQRRIQGPMKRLLPLGTALLLTACAAGTKPAPQAVGVGMKVRHPSVTAVAAARESKAGRKAERLLRRVVLPPSARRIRQPGGVYVLGNSDLGTSMLVEFAQRHAFWRVDARLPQVLAFVKTHALPGFDQPAGYAGSARFQRPVWRSLEFDGRQRLFAVTAVALHGSTVVRVDAAATWIYPRSPREVVPARVSEIDARDEGVARRVVDRAEVERIVRWFDALDVPPPGAHVICGPLVASNVRFTFRSARGAKLATAIAPSRPGDGCHPILFSIRGRRQAQLVDGVFGRRAFVNRVQRLLGLRFPQR